jgi:ATP/maltotriose-dependent transcriptional regulator MalT
MPPRRAAGVTSGYVKSLPAAFELSEGRQPAPTDQPLVEPLSEGELEVLCLAATGRSNLEIARELIIAVGTVRAHPLAIYRKLDVRGRAQAAIRARDLSLL